MTQYLTNQFMTQFLTNRILIQFLTNWIIPQFQTNQIMTIFDYSDYATISDQLNSDNFWPIKLPWYLTCKLWHNFWPIKFHNNFWPIKLSHHIFWPIRLPVIVWDSSLLFWSRHHGVWHARVYPRREESRGVAWRWVDKPWGVGPGQRPRWDRVTGRSLPANIGETGDSIVCMNKYKYRKLNDI